eukprot:13558052-Heterocapsa_arctica.AAC.1
MKELLEYQISDIDQLDRILALDRETLKAQFWVIDQLWEIGGEKCAREVVSRVIKPLSLFPPFLLCLIRDVYEGGRVQIVNGCPGAAKTDL